MARRVWRASAAPRCGLTIITSQLVLHIALDRPDIERVFRASMRILGCIERRLGSGESG
jgi:hypothetical protein